MFINTARSNTKHKRGDETKMTLEEAIESVPRAKGVGVEEKRATEYLLEMEE